jgi:hypothetical protein
MARSVILACLIVAACDSRRPIAVQILVPDLAGIETPISGILLAALPYDRDSILAAMERRAATPRPDPYQLDSAFQAFHGPFLAFGRAAWNVERATRRRDSVAASRTAAGQDSPAAQELGIRLRALEDTLTRLAPELTRTRAVLADAREALWPTMERLRGAAREWENATYAGYDTVVRTQSVDKMRPLIADTSDARGWGLFRITTGSWWVYARSPDPQDPNFQWYWNVRITRDTIRLDSATGRRLPRY